MQSWTYELIAGANEPMSAQQAKQGAWCKWS